LLRTPRKFIIHPHTNHLVVIETDHNATAESSKVGATGEDMDIDDESAAEVKQQKMDAEDNPVEERFLREMYAGRGKWASYIRYVPPQTVNSWIRYCQNTIPIFAILCKFPNLWELCMFVLC